MRYSKLFGKSVKGSVRGMVNASTDLLYRGGYIRESVAGRYFLLPLGMLVHQKIEGIIREEMNRAGGMEMLSPVLHPLELWRETNRTNTVGFELTKVIDRRGAEFALGGTAEEMFVDVVRKFQISYRDLPINLYQFSLKFRDELRARGGLLRVREFVMKDAYSFDRDEESFRLQYERMKETYRRIFERMGLDVHVVEADNGYIGGEYCHEFVVESDVGESRFFVSEDGKYCAHEDVARFRREGVNESEEVRKMEIVDQPEWVKTMDDNVKHYGKPRDRFLKNVVYRNRTSGQVVIVVIRGDLEVSQTKLEHVLGAVGQLEEAKEDDLRKLGTRSGWVHSWGHTGAYYVGDLSLRSVVNFIGGQKERTSDTFNVNYPRDFGCDLEADVAIAPVGCVDERGVQMSEKRGIEVGNIFQLGHHYSSLMTGASFADVDGNLKPYYMGCYGIGVGRTLAAIVEKYHDERGIRWPVSISPYRAHLVDIECRERGQEVYESLCRGGIDVLWDDRDVRAGEKFADCDLVGIPVRLVVSAKTGMLVEWKGRDGQQTEQIDLDEVLRRLL